MFQFPTWMQLGCKSKQAYYIEYLSSQKLQQTRTALEKYVLMQLMLPETLGEHPSHSVSDPASGYLHWCYSRLKKGAGQGTKYSPVEMFWIFK